jgi:hypothetical protein
LAGVLLTRFAQAVGLASALTGAAEVVVELAFDAASGMQAEAVTTTAAASARRHPGLECRRGFMLILPVQHSRPTPLSNSSSTLLRV